MSSSSEDEAERGAILVRPGGFRTRTVPAPPPADPPTQLNERDVPDAFAWASAKDKLKRSEFIDEETVTNLLKLDPTPLDSLSLKAKLMRANWEVQQLMRTHVLPAHHPGAFVSDGASMTPSQDALLSLSKLLTSCLNDLPDISTSTTRESEYSLNVARAKLSLLKAGHPSPNPTLAPCSVPPATNTPDPDTDLGALFAENSRIMLLALRPPALDVLYSSPTSPPVDVPTPSPPSPFSKMPPEILAEIFRHARKYAEERIPLSFDPVYGELHRPRRADPISEDFVGTRTGAQKFVLSLALVCKAWEPAARQVAFSFLHIRRTSQLAKLLPVLSDPDNTFASRIISINVRISTPAPDPEAVSSWTGGGRRNRGQYGIAGVWGAPDQFVSTSSGGRSRPEGELSQGAMFQQLVGLASNLKKLQLNAVGQIYSQSPFGTRHGGVDFLEPLVLSALASIPSLTTLCLGSAVDIEELELILLGLPTLLELHLDSGFDSVDGSTGISSDRPHSARLKSFTVGNGAARGYSPITDVQICWILEPCVQSIVNLELVFLAEAPGFAGVGGFFGVGGGGGAVVAPPFASANFADLLIRMGGNLNRLALRDPRLTGHSFPSFAAAPHNNNFDYAISHLTQLKELSIQFCYVGPGLLDSLRASAESIQSLFFSGVAGARGLFSCTELTRKIEGGFDGVAQFTNLERLVVSGHGRGGWSGAEIRRLKSVCDSRNIYVLFASV